MDSQSTPRRVLPKRKRKETSYFPTDSEASDAEAEEIGDRDLGAETTPQGKVSCMLILLLV